MLIDGGLKGAGKRVVSYLKERGITKLDYVVATHLEWSNLKGEIVSELP